MRTEGFRGARSQTRFSTTRATPRQTGCEWRSSRASSALQTGPDLVVRSFGPAPRRPAHHPAPRRPWLDVPGAPRLRERRRRLGPSERVLHLLPLGSAKKLVMRVSPPTPGGHVLRISYRRRAARLPLRPFAPLHVLNCHCVKCLAITCGAARKLQLQLPTFSSDLWVSLCPRRVAPAGSEDMCHASRWSRQRLASAHSLGGAGGRAWGGAGTAGARDHSGRGLRLRWGRPAAGRPGSGATATRSHGYSVCPRLRLTGLELLFLGSSV